MVKSTRWQKTPLGTASSVRPWDYARHVLPYFPRYQSVEALAKRLQDEYPYIYELEKIARRRGIEMYEPFQGARIGPFTVLAPSPARYLQLIIQSDKTPQQIRSAFLAA
jgi:hypothetical protein